MEFWENMLKMFALCCSYCHELKTQKLIVT